MPTGTFVEQMSGMGAALIGGMGGLLEGWRSQPAAMPARRAPDAGPCSEPVRCERLVGLGTGEAASLLMVSGWMTDGSGRTRPLSSREIPGIEPRLAARFHRTVLQRAAELAAWRADHADEDVVLCHLPASALRDRGALATIASIADGPIATREALAVLVPATADAVAAVAALPQAWCEVVGLSVDRPDELDRLTDLLTLPVAAIELGVGAVRALASDPTLGAKVVGQLRRIGTPVTACDIASRADVDAALSLGIHVGRGPLLTTPGRLDA